MIGLVESEILRLKFKKPESCAHIEKTPLNFGDRTGIRGFWILSGKISKT